MKKPLTIEEVRAISNRIEVRDNERDVHIGDLLHVVCTRPKGFDLMHEGDVQKNIAHVPGPRKHKKRVYRVSLQEIY